MAQFPDQIPDLRLRAIQLKYHQGSSSFLGEGGSAVARDKDVPNEEILSHLGTNANIALIFCGGAD